jgi:hypothetical protein
MKHRRFGSRTFRVGALTLSLLGIGFAIHCGTDPRNGFSDDPCVDAFGDQCGKPCQDETQCSKGMFCTTDKKCSAECAPNSTCASGIACSANGRCSGPDSGGTTPGFGDSGLIPDDGGTGGDASCADINVTLAKITPTVLLLIDQSGSMTDFEYPADSGITRWEALRQALIDPATGIVKQLQNDVSFGVALYSWKRSGMCPNVTNVPWKVGNYASIFNIYADAGTIDNTPTAESIMSVIGFNDAGVLNGKGFAAAHTPGPKILVLATDGDPDMCSDPDSNGDQAPRQFTVWATQRTYDAGIPTYVISVGEDIDLAHQKQVANAGQGQNPNTGDAAVYRPTNKTALVNALNKVILGVRSCKFTLNGSVVAGTENKGVVTLNGTPLTYNDSNGWKLNSPTELEFVGNSCKTLQTTLDAQVSVRFPCGSVTFPK